MAVSESNRGGTHGSGNCGNEEDATDESSGGPDRGPASEQGYTSEQEDAPDPEGTSDQGVEEPGGVSGETRAYKAGTESDSEDTRLRRKLDRSEGRFELLVQAVKEYAIFMIDTDGYVQTWNEGAKRIKGYSKEEIVGRHFSNFYTEEDRERGRPETGLKSAREEGQWTDEGWRVRKDGSRFWARVTITALYDDEDELRGFAKVTRDLTERHEYEEKLANANEKLRETERLKDEFFASVSHEMRTPLTLILSPVEAMLAENEAEDSSRDSFSPAQRRRLETVHNNSIRMLQMVNGLLDFSKLEIGEVKVDREPTDIEGLTRTICQDFRPLSERKGLDLTVEVDVAHPLVEIDRYLYERILFNLLSNAVKFTPSGGEVWVRLSQTTPQQENGRLELAVADTGKGVHEEELEDIFKDFRQIDASATRRFEGTGLGLPLVKEFADLLGGQVSVRSTLGVGSTFTVSLLAPLSNQKEKPEGQQRAHILAKQYDLGQVPEGTDPGRTFKNSDRRPAAEREVKRDPEGEEWPEIVLAEDNVGLSTYIEELLADTCGVHVAGNGEEALRMVRDLAPELVITDVMMPGKDGLELCRELKENPNTAEIPVVMLTALTNREALLRGWEAGADEYLFKPFHPKELVTRIRTLLRNIERRKDAEKTQKKLERKLLQTSERERRRIGQALHDGLASHMTGLSTIAQGLMAKQEGDRVTVDTQSLQRIVDLAQEGARQARTMARGLNPVKLGRKGLPAALQTVAENQEFRFDVACTFEQDGSLPTLPENASLNLYWIAHEAVHNAIEHGNASRVSIQLSTDAGRVVLNIVDDGAGLPKPVEEIEEGMGLSTMRYRADLIGASLEIINRDDGGVRVSCVLPVPSTSEESDPERETTV